MDDDDLLTDACAVVIRELLAWLADDPEARRDSLLGLLALAARHGGAALPAALDRARMS